MEGFFGKFKALTQNSDVVIAIGLMVVLGVMVVPIPPLLLDMMLSLSIAISVGVLLTAVYAKKPLDFSTFPTVLLVQTSKHRPWIRKSLLPVQPLHDDV